jgi:enoyl-CoA hydratase/carnithine racemase
MTEPLLLRQDVEGLCTLTLNRPASLNALSTELFEILDAELGRLESQGDAIGCVVIRGAGRAFCAGADLKASQSGMPPAPFNYKPRILERLANLPLPVIAAIHGICYGGGLELALAADIIVADKSARFADSHGKWGYVAAWGLTQRLPRRIGLPQAKRMMFTSRDVSGEEALSLGLIEILAEEGQLGAALGPLTAAILANSRHTNRETKRMLCATEDLALRDGLAHETYRAPGPAPDTKERIAAFVKKG